jgi:hypothetical protein|nr:MAG TPA: hypothetical protein [Caudoviricetes sp.]
MGEKVRRRGQGNLSFSFLLLGYQKIMVCIMAVEIQEGGEDMDVGF